MSREQAVELLKQYKLAEIIKAVQAAWQQGYDQGKANAIQLRADMDDDIPF